MSLLQRVPFKYHQQLQKQIMDRVIREYDKSYENETAFWVTWVDGDQLTSWPQDKRVALMARLVSLPPIPAGHRRIHTFYTCYHKQVATVLEYVDFPASEFKEGAFEAGMGEGSALRPG